MLVIPKQCSIGLIAKNAIPKKGTIIEDNYVNTCMPFYHNIFETNNIIDKVVESCSVELYGKTKINSIDSTITKLKDDSEAQMINSIDTFLEDNSKADKITSDIVELSKTTYAKTIETKKLLSKDKSLTEKAKADEAEIKNNARVEKVIVKDSLKIRDNAIVGDVIVTGKSPEIIISDNAQITGKIIFENTSGIVKLQKGKNNAKPKINEEQVINGKIKKNFKPTGFENVAGMYELKETLYMDVIEPITKPELYKQYGLKPINGCLLYGPPGCGKTYIANALAEEAGRYFVEVRLSQISSPYQNLTNVNLKNKFKEAEKNAPAIIFLDEIETLAPCRESLYGNTPETSERVTELLTLINNCKDKNVFVICASNEPQKIDAAIRRSGRMDKKIYVGPPDDKTREEIFKMNLAHRLTDENIDYKLIGSKTRNYISSDISFLVDESARFALKDKKPISTEHILKAISSTKPSLTQSEIDYYKNKLDTNYDQ